jgi:hypothetical protein
MSKIPELLKWPFCLTQSIEANPGAIICPKCDAKFEIDDRLECVFANTKNPRLPAIGTICKPFGLIQAGSHQNCLYCGTVICAAVQ